MENPHILALKQRKVKEVKQKPTTELSGKCEDPKQLCLQRRERSDCSERPVLPGVRRGSGRIGTLDCRTAVFQRKGPRSLQYSNSLNETSIFRFLQLVSAMSSVSITCTHSGMHTGPSDRPQVFPPFCHLTCVTVVTPTPSCFRPSPRPSLVCQEYSLEGERSSMSPKRFKVPVVSDGDVTRVTRWGNPLRTIRPACSFAVRWIVGLGGGDNRHSFRKVRFLKQISYNPCNF